MFRYNIWCVLKTTAPMIRFRLRAKKGPAPPLGNFADISYFEENFKHHAVCSSSIYVLYYLIYSMFCFNVITILYGLFHYIFPTMYFTRTLCSVSMLILTWWIQKILSEGKGLVMTT